jgi:pyridoxine 5-phosphate synthase
MIELGVNIDHVATLRQARRGVDPDPVWAAVQAHLGGADGITVHLREDRRHIQDDDVRRLRTHTQIKLNFEMAATPEMLAMACDIRPEMAMLVPEGRQEITTEGGLDVIRQHRMLAPIVQRLRDAGIRASAFIDAQLDQVVAAAELGFEVCEVHTGPYAAVFHSQGRDALAPPVCRELDRIAQAGERIVSLGMRFNAGHALNYFNVQPVAALAGVRELHIGHAIVSRAVLVGMREAVTEMKRLMREAQTERTSMRQRYESSARGEAS